MSWRIGTHPWLDRQAPAAVRVVVDNDFAGDPDDLPQLAHHLLSPGAEVRAVISSHLAPGDPFDPSAESAQHGVDRVRRMLDVMRCDDGGRLLLGTTAALVDRSTPQRSAGVDAIIAEARAEDDRPLLVAVGGGLTDVASALLTAPDIADRMTVVWIGGPEYPDLAEPPPGDPAPEYNLNIDLDAARVVFEDSTVPVWQVPRDAYRQAIVTETELRTRMRSAGRLGEFLFAELDALLDRVATWRGHQHATYVLGDQPLVLLTSLLTVFEPSPAGCRSVVRAGPVLGDDGRIVGATGRDVRVFTHLDTRLMFEDMFATLAEFADWREE